jgi:hypothetical protein
MIKEQSYSHIHSNFLPIMAMSDADRISSLDNPRWIGYARAIEILDILQGLLNKPKRPRMPNLLIVGESNNGKTTLIRRFHELCGKSYVNENGDSVRPIILCETSNADERYLYSSILDRFWTPYRPTDPPIKLRYQVLHLMRACHVQMLIVDEFHTLLSGTAIKQREAMNTLKGLCNELCIPIVGVGTNEAVRVLHSDPQHASRFDVVSLPKWSLNTDFQKLLASFEKILPLKKASQLHKPELAQLLYAISDGNIGNLHRLLIECAKEAILTGKEQIDAKVITGKQSFRPTKGVRHLLD